MTRILTLDQISTLLKDVDVVREMETAFTAYSAGKVTVPPVGELLFPETKGEAHIKYGAIRGGEHFVVKIATGFFGNPALGLPPFGGCMLLFSQRNGQIEAVLLEEGSLTNVRTAAAGAVAAKYLAPAQITRIGILGAGVQGRLQADFLRGVTACRDLAVWARAPSKAEEAARDIAAMGYKVSVAGSVREIGQSCSLIVTTTPSNQPILTEADVRPGTHITAMGSDTPDKIELEPSLVRRADILVVDSLPQSRERGEVFKAAAHDRAVELGAVIAGTAKGRTDDRQISIADLTGVAAQDIAIAEAIYRRSLPPSI